MPQVIALPPFAAEFFGGKERLTVAGTSLFAVVRELDRAAPGFADTAEERAAMAVNGTVQADWSARLEPDDEILIVPKVAGG
ncbi:MAG: MoaD/ThiS family protein [Novosphingobium sp.]